MSKTYRIAVIPGDGIGKETTPEGLRVLDAIYAFYEAAKSGQTKSVKRG